jgi:hypothetical protein
MTYEQFLNYRNNIDDSHVKWLLNDVIPRIISIETELNFVLTEIPSVEYPFIEVKGNNHELIPVGGWQSIDTVTLKYGTETRELIKDVDYELIRLNERPIMGEPNPIIRLRTLNGNSNYSNNFRFNREYPINQLQTTNYINNKVKYLLTGVYGFSNGLPIDLEKLLYEVVFNSEIIASNKRENNSFGFKKKEETVRRKVEYIHPFVEDTRDRDFSYYLINNPSIRKLIDKYKQYSNNTRIS